MEHELTELEIRRNRLPWRDPISGDALAWFNRDDADGDEFEKHIQEEYP